MLRKILFVVFTVSILMFSNNLFAEINSDVPLKKPVLSKEEVVFITRINSEKANYLLDLYDDARFYEGANCLIIG